MLATSTIVLCCLFAAPQGDPERVSESVRHLPTLGISIRDVRSLDLATGRVVRETTDAATGQPVDANALVIAEERARNLVRGRLGPDLARRIDDETFLEVVFWLDLPEGRPDLRAVLDAYIAGGLSSEDARRAALAVAEEWTERVTRPFATDLAAAGYEVLYVDPYAPIVFVGLPTSAISALARHPGVDQVYVSSPAWESEVGGVPDGAFRFNEWASPSARTDAVHRRGVNGSGAKVMVNDTAPVVTNNPYLPPIVSGSPGSPASHATAVAGIISSNHSTLTGAAPGLIQLYDYGASGDVNAPIAWAWGMGQGISFGNISWWNFQKGAIHFLDRYFDYIIRNFGVMMFKSIGNQGGGDARTTTPGNGYNVTGSGNANDQNTHDWDDDTMSGSSSWVNPAEGHDKPEVAAHGSGIYSTKTSSPWTGSVGSGTSYASPVTCGTAALLAATDPALAAKPEVVKAMLMAGAWNNIEGNPVMSDKDGAGGIDAAASQSAVADGQYVSTTLTPGSFSGGIWSTQIALDDSDETRVVALWFSNADSSYGTDVLDMDLDMTIEDPSGAVVASSASALNAFEIAAFIPPVTGVYTVKLHNMQFNGTQEMLAVAWTTRQDAATDTITGSRMPP